MAGSGVPPLPTMIRTGSGDSALKVTGKMKHTRCDVQSQLMQTELWDEADERVENENKEMTF